MTQVLSADEMKQCCAFVFCPPGNLALKGLYVTLGKKEKHGTIPGDVRCVHNMMESQTVVTNLLPCWQLNNYVISTKQIKVGKRIGSDHHPIFSKRKKKNLDKYLKKIFFVYLVAKVAFVCKNRLGFV